jgi:phage N-6-adenine-methyltransferase
MRQFSVEHPRSCWRTPDAVYSLLHSEFDFNIDGAADASNAKCARWLDRASDAFTHDSSASERIFLNPPYSGTKYGEHTLRQWVELAVRWRSQGGIVVMLLPASTSERWFSFASERSDHVRLLTPRVQFVPRDGVRASSNTMGSAVFVMDGVDRPQKIVVWNWRNQNGGH